jgi:hypothetical protein
VEKVFQHNLFLFMQSCQNFFVAGIPHKRLIYFGNATFCQLWQSFCGLSKSYLLRSSCSCQHSCHVLADVMHLHILSEDHVALTNQNSNFLCSKLYCPTPIRVYTLLQISHRTPPALVVPSDSHSSTCGPIILYHPCNTLLRHVTYGLMLRYYTTEVGLYLEP